MSQTLPSFSDRWFFLDILKAICIVAVVSYHAIFVPRSTYESSFVWLDMSFAPLRFCVPVLLTISMMLSERALDKQNYQEFLIKRCRRLGVPMLFWFSVAGLLKLINNNSAIEILQMMVRGEIFSGAYYLLVLFQLTFLLTGLRQHLKHARNLAVIIAGQYLVFIIIHKILVDQPTIAMLLKSLDRPLIIYWFGYIALGILIYHNLPKLIEFSNRSKLLPFATIGVLIILEYRNLQQLTNASVPPFDYTMVSALIMVPIMFLWAIRIDENKLPTLLKTIIRGLSHYSLGIFCINGILSQIFLAFGSRWCAGMTFNFAEILLIKLAGWIVLVVLASGLSIGLSRIGLKSLVA